MKVYKHKELDAGGSGESASSWASSIEPRIRKELGLDEPPEPLTRKERVAVATVELIRKMPWITALVIGSVVSQFNIKELHHPFWPSVILDFGVPLLLVGLIYLLSDGSNGRRADYGFSFGLVPLLLFLLMWPVFMQVRAKTITAKMRSPYQSAPAKLPSAQVRR